MIYSDFDGIRISAISASVPEDVIEINSLKATEDPRKIESFIKKTGIAQVHKCDFGQTASDFSYTAAKVLENAGRYKPEEIGVLLDVTQTPDYRCPSTAMALHKRLGLGKSCIAFDINLGCSGFVYGVSVAASILTASTANKALVLVGDTLARQRMKTTMRTSNTMLLFGDASSAILLEKTNGFNIKTALMSDGTGFKVLGSTYGAWKHPEERANPPFDDMAVFSFTISEVPALLKAFMEKTNTGIEDYDDLVLHQANMMIMKQIAKKVNMPMEKVPVSLDRYGNTSGASVPVSIVDKYGECDDGRELNLLTSGFGVGLSWGVVSFKINVNDIFPMTIGKDTYDDGYSD